MAGDEKVPMGLVLRAFLLLPLCGSAIAADMELVAAERKISNISKSFPREDSISPKEWDSLNGQISRTVASIKNPSSLADLALWCYFTGMANERLCGSCSILMNARDACVYRISTIHSVQAKAAILKVKRNVLLDGGIALDIRHALKQLGVVEKITADFTFISPKRLESLPILSEDLQARSEIIESFWLAWEKKGPAGFPREVTAECEVRLCDKPQLKSIIISGLSAEADKQKLTEAIWRVVSYMKLPTRYQSLRRVDFSVSIRDF